jgi:hypothetical protein
VSEVSTAARADRSNITQGRHSNRRRTNLRVTSLSCKSDISAFVFEPQEKKQAAIAARFTNVFGICCFYAFLSVQPPNFELFRSACGTGRFTSGP